MEKYFKRSILDELYELKGDEFADNILKVMEKEKKSLESLEVEEQLTKKIKEVVTDEKKQKELLELLKEYELKSGKDDDFWNKMYYKLGAYDCAEMKTILVNENIKETENTFLDDFTDDFMDYLEDNRTARLRKKAEYLETEKKINKIKNENPKVRSFIDDRETVKLSEKETETVLEVLSLQGDLDTMEYKETFKLGVREVIVFLKQMNLL